MGCEEMKHKRFFAAAILSAMFFSIFALVPHAENKAVSVLSNFISADISRDSLTNDNVESSCAFSKIKTSSFSLKKGKADFLIPDVKAHILIQTAFLTTFKNAVSPTDKLIENINSRAP